MPYALVGSAGAVLTGASGAAVMPAYGAGASRAAGNLLVLEVASTGSATLPAAISGWLIAKQQAGTTCSASIYYKVAAGADAAPTVPIVAGAVHSAQLYEFSGGAQTTPLDQTAGVAGTTTPIVGTAAAADANAGSLLVASGAVLHSAARADASAHTLNNGAASTETSNAGTSITNHYDFTYGVTTGKAAADSDSFAFTTTQLTGAVVAVASFKPAPPTPLLAGQHHRRPPIIFHEHSRGRF